jgi:transcriptional regulator with XRE-family HTH domain
MEATLYVTPSGTNYEWLFNTKIISIADTKIEMPGIEYNNLYNIYTSQNLPRLTTLFMINQAFGIPADFWFKSLEKMTEKQKESMRRKLTDGEILKTFYKLDDNARDTLLKILRGYNRKQTREIK